MKTITIKRLVFLIAPILLITGCTKDYTNYYPDDEDKGVAIFSSTANNVMGCFIDGKAWRTGSRTTSLFSPPRYEVYITKQNTSSLLDTLSISWSGYYAENKDMPAYLELILPVAKTFNYLDLSALRGQRLQLDTTNGFFSTSIPGLNNPNSKGRGHIYFHTARFDSISPGVFKGTMSGLFEADFGSFKILRGRFDHNITEDQVDL